MKMGIHKNPQVYHFMPECQDNDYQGNNYVLRACRYCCSRYSKEVAKSGGIDVYLNNVLTSQGSKEAPQFLDDPRKLPEGLPLEDLSGLRRRDRLKRVQDLTERNMASAKASVPAPWSEPTRAQLMQDRFEISVRHQMVPGPIASEVDTTSWDQISEQERREMNEALLEHLQDANGEFYDPDGTREGCNEGN